MEDKDKKSEETIYQYEVDYSLNTIEEIRNWLIEYGCLDVDERMELPPDGDGVWQDGRRHCTLSPRGEMLTISNSYVGSAYYNMFMYSTIKPDDWNGNPWFSLNKYQDFFISKMDNRLKKTDLPGCSREAALDYCNAIMDQFGINYENVDIYAITDELIQDTLKDPNYKYGYCAPGYDFVTLEGGEWNAGDGAYVLIYRNQSFFGVPVRYFRIYDYAIYSPKYGLVSMQINLKPNYRTKKEVEVITREEAEKIALEKFESEWPMATRKEILSCELVWVLDGSTVLNKVNEKEFFSPYWNVKWSFSLPEYEHGEFGWQKEGDELIMEMLVQEPEIRNLD